MNPQFLDAMSWEMAEVYGAITDRILINLARYFPYMTAGNIPRSAFDYQAAMLAQMGQVNRDTMQIIRDGLQGADKALGRVLEQSIIDAIRKTEKPLLNAVKSGIFKPAGVPIVAPNQMRAFSLYYQQAANKLNLVNTVMLESTRQAYQATVADVVSRVQATQTALDIAAGEAVTGVSSWNMAMRHAIDRMKDNGITGFIDHGGHKWSAEAYVAMDIRTTVYNTGRAAVWETNQNFGNDLYIVSYHDGARPGCYPWQNKVISATDDARTVTDLDGNEIEVIRQSDTSYGEAAGLFGINCKHYPTPFIPGVSALYDEGQIPSEKENEKIYENTQTQRDLERQLREQKRDLLMAKAQGASDAEIKVLRQKCRDTSDQIDEFCKETGLPRRQNREGVFTQRDFPDADKYDVAAFERKQKDEIDQFFSGGGSQQGYTFGQMTQNTPAEVLQTPTPAPEPTPAQAQSATEAFTPAKTINEAEEFAKTFVDTDMWASHGISLEGMTVESANMVNQRLSEFYKTYNVDKFSSLVAPAGNTKLGKAISGAHAGFNPVNRAFVVNRNSFKNPLKAAEALAKEKNIVTDYIANPDKYSYLNKYTLKMLENSRTSGRFSVPTTLEEIIDHECGHALEKALRNVSNYDTIVANMGTYAPGISGYAQEKFGEYVAESFCAWRKGGITVDPEIIKAFEELRR